MKYEQMYRCKECGKIYEQKKLKTVCPKCGNIMMGKNVFGERIPGCGNTQIIIAKKKLFKYQIKEVVKDCTLINP